jgi:hypothetical protein
MCEVQSQEMCLAELTNFSSNFSSKISRLKLSFWSMAGAYEMNNNLSPQSCDLFLVGSVDGRIPQIAPYPGIGAQRTISQWTGTLTYWEALELTSEPKSFWLPPCFSSFQHRSAFLQISLIYLTRSKEEHNYFSSSYSDFINLLGMVAHTYNLSYLGGRNQEASKMLAKPYINKLAYHGGIYLLSQLMRET